MRFAITIRTIAVIRALALIGVLLAGPFAYATEEKRCAICRKVIRGKYFQSNGRNFCSRRCFEKTLPRCAACGHPITGEYLVHDGRKFCSERCFSSVLPKCVLCGKRLREAVVIQGKYFCSEHAKSQRCLNCGLPFLKGIKLSDGRAACDDCKGGLVLDSGEAESLYRRAQEKVKAAIGLISPTIPPLQLVGADELPDHPRLPNGAGIEERGRYLREETTRQFRDPMGRFTRRKVSVEEKILILYGLSRMRFLAAASHELGHDICSETFPQLGDVGVPLWLEEAVCQYIAVEACRKVPGAGGVVAEIEESQHPVYGRGYRYLKTRFGERNWSRLAKWLASDEIYDLPQNPE